MRLLPLAIAFSLAAVCYGDIITLKNGRTINGTYLGGTPRQIKVEVGDNIQTLDVGDIARIEFNGGGGGGSDSAREAPRDNGRPTLRRADAGGSDSSSSSSGGSSSGGYGSGGSGGSGSRPVILQPDPNDTGSYPQSTASDNSRPTLRRAPSSSSTDSAPSSSGNSGSSSSSSNDGDRPVLHRAAPAPASDAGTPAAAPAPSAPAPTAPAAAAPASPTPPAPAPPPPTIKVGQTQDSVIAALGQPDSVSAEGNKQIYVYKSAKVTFVNGKVSKVE